MNDFRPRLPLNPFNDGYNPWRLNKQCLVLDPTPYIVLFIGDPLQADILPLLHSPRLSHSLILIATHTPPSLPLIPTGPSVCILRLAQPLAVHDSGALRLASLIDRAQRIAAAHPNSSSPRLIQLTEDGHNGPFAILEPYVAAEHPSSHVSSPFSSPHEPSPAPSIASEASSSQAFFRSHSPSKRRHAKPSKKANITRRPFDAIINCLPSGLAEKALLKHAILVTTLTAPFLISPPSFDDHNKRHSSSFFRSTPDLEAHMPTSANVSAHIVHVLPRGFSLTSTSTSMSAQDASAAAVGSSSSAGSSLPNIPLPPKNPLRQPYAKEKQNEVKPKLVQSIEQFLLAFGYPLHSISSAPEDRKGKKKIEGGDARPGIRHASTFGDQQQKKREIPVPYLVAAGILGYVLRLDGAGTQASLGEALLLGALDPVDDFGGGGKAWIGNGGEVVVEGDDAADDPDVQVVLTLPPPVRTKSSRRKPERRMMMSDHDKEVGIGANGLPTPPESAEGSSRSNSSMESGYTSEDEVEVQQRRLGRSVSGRRGGGGGVKERWARVGRRSSKTRRSAHGQHAQNAPLQFQGRAFGLDLPGVPGRSEQEREPDGGDSSEALHKRKPSLKKRNALTALLNSQGLGHLKFWSRREVECVK